MPSKAISADAIPPKIKPYSLPQRSMALITSSATTYRDMQSTSPLEHSRRLVSSAPIGRKKKRERLMPLQPLPNRDLIRTASPYLSGSSHDVMELIRTKKPLWAIAAPMDKSRALADYESWKQQEEEMIVRRLRAMDVANENRKNQGVSPLVSCTLDQRTLHGGLERVVAGVPVNIGLTCEYNFGGGITSGDHILKQWCDNCGGFTCQVIGPEEVPSNISYMGTGRYIVSYTATIAGKYIVHLQLGGRNIAGTPIHSEVEAGPTDVLQCSASGMGLLCGEAGAEGTFSITARDHYANPRVIGGDAFVVSFHGPMSFSPTVVDHNNGAYSVRYTTIMCGSYTVHITLNERHIPGSPFLLSVIAGRSYGPSCAAEGAGLRGCVAGDEASFTIRARDIVGNSKIIGGDPFVVDMEGPSAPRVSVLDRDDGSYEVNYIAHACGTYTVKVLLFDMPILNSPFLVTIQSGVIKAQTCTVIGNGVEGFSIGEKIQFTIEARDALRNKRSVGGDIFDVTVRGAVNPPAMVEDKANGEYHGRYNTTKAGVYFVTISLGGIDVSGSPFKVIALPGPTHALGCECSGAGIQGGFVGVEAQFEIHARDIQGNQKISGGDIFNVEITGTASPMATIRDMFNGHYVVTYTPPVGGDYYISIKHNGIDLPNTPFLISVDPVPKDTYLQLYRGTQQGTSEELQAAVRKTYLEENDDTAQMNEGTEQMWDIVAKVIGGRDIIAGSGKGSNASGPHVLLKIGNAAARTSNAASKNRPIWNHEITLKTADRLEKLKLFVYTSTEETTEWFAGCAEISLLDLIELKPRITKVCLQEVPSGEIDVMLTLRSSKS